MAVENQRLSLKKICLRRSNSQLNENMKTSNGTSRRESTKKPSTKKGHCQQCGSVRTHTKRYRLSKRRIDYTPLTVSGEVYEGHCLHCSSIEDIMAKIGEAFQDGSSKDAPEEKCSLTAESPENSSNGSKRKRSRRISLRSSRRKKKAVPSTNRDNTTTSSQTNGVIDADCVVFDGGASDEMEAIRRLGSVLENMNTHCDDVVVQEGGCRALCTYSSSGQVSSNPEVVEEKMSDDTNAEACANIAALGGIFSIFSAMHTHKSSRILLENGMRTLKNILRTVSNSRQTMINNAVVELVMRVMMETENTSSAIHEDGCAILWSLAFGDTGVQHAIIQCDGVATVLAGMGFFPESKMVQQNGCGLLHTLSATKDFARNIFLYGGFDVVIGSIGHHIEQRELVEYAFGTMVNLSVHSLDMCDERLDGMNQQEIEIISEATRSHPSSDNVQESGSYLLKKISMSSNSPYQKNQHL